MTILENLSMTKNIVITMLHRRKNIHIVHGDGFPRLDRSGKRGVHNLILNGWFGDGTSTARFDIFSNILSKFWPIKIIF